MLSVTKIDDKNIKIVKNGKEFVYLAFFRAIANGDNVVLRADSKASTFDHTEPYTSVEVNGTIHPSSAAAVKALNEFVNFKPGGGSPSPTPGSVEILAPKKTIDAPFALQKGQVFAEQYFVALPTLLRSSGNGTGAAFSPDGTLFVMTTSSATGSYHRVYERDGDTFTLLPATTPIPGTGTGSVPTFSPDGKWFAMAQSAAPFCNVWSVNGTTFTKLAALPDPPTVKPVGVTFSPDGEYLVFVQGATPWLHIYKRDGNTFTKLPNPAALPTGTAYAVAFSPDGVHLVVGHGNTPYITIYKRTGDTFTKLPNPASLPPAVRGIVFSQDGELMVLAIANRIAEAYTRSGDTFTKLPAFIRRPGQLGYTGDHVVLSPDKSRVVAGLSAPPYVEIFEWNGETFAYTTLMRDTPKNPVLGLALSQDGEIAAAVYNQASINGAADSLYKTFEYAEQQDGDTRTVNVALADASEGSPVEVSSIELF